MAPAADDAPQLKLPLGPQYAVLVDERFTPGLTGRQDRSYRSPPQEREAAEMLAALLLDAAEGLSGDGPWVRAIAGGRRTVTLAAEEAAS